MIKFYSLIPNLIKDMPILPASIKGFEWYKNMANDFKSCHSNNMHTFRCPGINRICKMGWVQRAYQDFSISTVGDKLSFSFKCEVDQAALQYGHLMDNYVNSHPYEQLFKYGEFKKDTLRTIIKIQSPWLVDIPKGYSLLSIPIPYSDEKSFTAAMGIVSGFMFLNVQLFWHELNGEVKIKKGTPLVQYILVKNEDIEFSVNTVTDNVLEKINNLFLVHS